MTRIGFLDRLQTIVATATVTSAVWIVVGTVYVDRNDDRGGGSVPEGAAPAVQAVAPTGESPPAGDRLTIPVVGVGPAQLVDSFADARGGRKHEAIDIAAPAGTAVVAAAPGTVEKLYVSEEGGNAIYVRSNDRRTIHYYAHLRTYAAGLAEGQRVSRGQQLGEVGSTGNADPAAPHLHFAVFRTSPEARWWESGTADNPYPLLKAAFP
jgi:murein DD-endopeptidase MepM/ murein hydrolase activator NlpD